MNIATKSTVGLREHPRALSSLSTRATALPRADQDYTSICKSLSTCILSLPFIHWFAIIDIFFLLCKTSVVSGLYCDPV